MKKLLFSWLALTLAVASVSLTADLAFAGGGLEQDYAANASLQPEVHRTSWGAVKSIYRGLTPLAYTTTRAESTAAALRKPSMQPYSIGTPDNFVRNELWYSLRAEWLNKPNDLNGPGGNGTKSNWHWLSKSVDANANGLRYALNTYQTCVSDDIPPVCSCCRIDKPGLMASPKNTVEYWVNYLSADTYAVRDAIGRGTQCVSYVTMIIYRATGGRYQLKWSWSDYTSTSHPVATEAQVGDIVYYNLGTGKQHVGFCAKKYPGGMTVVDSNYLGYEVIGRHDVSNAELTAKWRVVSGLGKWR